VAFDPKKIRLERFRVEIVYHAAYDFWNLRGLLAERWAHGPVFGAVGDQGNLIKLTPEGGFADDRVEANYGLRSASFEREFVKDRKLTYEESRAWMGDVIEALDPKRTSRISTQWFALYPLGNIDAAKSADRKLRLRYYDKERLRALVPDAYPNQFGAVNSLCVDGDKQWSAIIGLVGPPHKNQFFGVPDKERDERWWMGLNFSLTRFNEKGLVEGSPMEAMTALIDEGCKEYERLSTNGLGSVL
jgi:hypothetical protein